MGEKRLSIQNILLPVEEPQASQWNLYYQGAELMCDTSDSGENRLFMGGYKEYNFCSYFNAFSIEKWKKYTNIKKFYLILDIEGKFEVSLDGYHLEAEVDQRTRYLKKKFQNDSRKKVEIEIPLDNQEMLFAFSIRAYSDCVLYGGTYDAIIDEDELNEVNIAISTTTFRKEEYIKTNVEMIKNELISDPYMGEHWFMHVVDNGKTLEREEIESKHIFYHPNKNVGGAGGFARGMIEVLDQKEPITHILLMDDDVLIYAEALKRTYYLLHMIKEKYKEYVISGAMLNLEEMNLFWEDTAYISGGVNRATKEPRDMRKIKNLLLNENIIGNFKDAYAAWWYCCIPVDKVKENGLPLPVFIRGDDIEFGVRNQFKLITMNGISLWHMGFATKYSAFMNGYQAFRNLLIMNACNGKNFENDIIATFEDRIIVELHRFNYNVAKALLDAWNDYMKGPKFIEEERCGEILSEKSKLNAEMKDLKEFDVNVNLTDVYKVDPINYIQRVFYRLTQNGQRFWPRKWMDETPAVISFDEFYNPQRETFHSNLLAVNVYTKKAEMRSIDKKKYKVLKKRLKYIKNKYEKNKDKIRQEYREEQPYLVSREFWNKYLEIEKYQ